MIKPAPANAGASEPELDDADLEAAAGLPVQRGSAIVTLLQAVEMTGLSESTVRRMIDRWLGGDRSDDALKGGRTRRGRRYADRADTEALGRQLRGEIGPGRHPEQPPTGDGA